MEKGNFDIVVIVGPTCSGKSEFAFYLAKKLKSEIISADSRQIFKELNIGTAKPPIEFLNRIPHHLINHISISEEYNVANFVKDAGYLIEGIKNKNKLPIIAGGTGLYINSLLYGILEGAGKNEEIRNRLQNEMNNFGLEHLYNKLVELDPETASIIDKQNPRRVLRALEIYYITGKKYSELKSEQNRDLKYKSLIFGLKWDRKILYERINKRVDAMVNDGLIEEVKELYNLFKGRNLQAFQTVGYKELIDYLNMKNTLQEAIDLIKRNTRRYAKRQMTWFIANKDIIWLEIDESVNLSNLADRIIKDYKLNSD